MVLDKLLSGIKKTFGFDYRGENEVEAVWKERLSSLFGEGNIRIKSEHHTPRDGDEHTMYTISFFPTKHRGVSSIEAHVYYRPNEKGKFTESHNYVYTKALELGYIPVSAFIRSESSMKSYKKFLNDIESRCGPFHEPEKASEKVLSTSKNEMSEFGWTSLSQMDEKLFGEGLIRIEDVPPNKKTILPKGYGYMSFIINEPYGKVLLESGIKGGLLKIGHFNNKTDAFEFSSDAGFALKTIERLLGPDPKC